MLNEDGLTYSEEKRRVSKNSVGEEVEIEFPNMEDVLLNSLEKFNLFKIPKADNPMIETRE